MIAGLPEKARTALGRWCRTRRGSVARASSPCWSRAIVNPLLNGEVIRLDGALRMPPR